MPLAVPQGLFCRAVGSACGTEGLWAQHKLPQPLRPASWKTHWCFQGRQTNGANLTLLSTVFCHPNPVSSEYPGSASSALAAGRCAHLGARGGGRVSHTTALSLLGQAQADLISKTAGICPGSAWPLEVLAGRLLGCALNTRVWVVSLGPGSVRDLHSVHSDETSFLLWSQGSRAQGEH